MSAITTATIVGIAAAGASTAGTVYAAKKGAKAAKDAAAQQSDAADKALALQKESYAQQRQDFSPYQAAGREAMSRMQDMSNQPRMTFNPADRSSFLGPPGSQGPQIGRAQAGMMAPQLGAAGPQASLGNPTGAPPASGAVPPQVPPGSGMAPAGAPGGMVMMRGQDGVTKPVPPQVADQLTQRGFTRV